MRKRFESSAWVWVAGVSALAVIAIVADRYISTFSAHVIADQEKWGQFGDYFGGVLNPILSFFAFIAILITLREQVKSGREGDERHDEQVRDQRFFQLVSLIGQSSSEVTAVFSDHANHTCRGRQATHGVWVRFSEREIMSVRDREYAHELARFEALKTEFMKWRRSNWPSVGNYIESIFVAIGYVSAYGRSDDAFLHFGLSVLKAQLSESERLLVWYSSLCVKEYSVHSLLLEAAGFVSDEGGSLDDPMKPYRNKLLLGSQLYWDNFPVVDA